MSDAQTIHEALRSVGCTTTDEPWNLCSAEYRMRFENAIVTLDAFVSREDYESLEDDYEALGKEKRELESEKVDVEDERDAANAKVDDLESEADDLRAQVSALEARIAELEDEEE